MIGLTHGKYALYVNIMLGQIMEEGKTVCLDILVKLSPSTACLATPAHQDKGKVRIQLLGTFVKVTFITCKSGWTYFAHTDKCYKYISSMYTFQQARDYCKRQAPTQYKGDSVSIKDRQTDNFLKSIAKKNRFWTSGCKIGGKFVWGDGTGFSFTNWGRQQPDNWNGREGFVEVWPTIWYGSWVWNDENENSKLCAICEY